MATAAAGAALPPNAYGAQASGRWAMRLVIVTEASFFAYLLFSYFYLGSMAATWPPNGPPSLGIAGPDTVILLISSGTVWWAETGIEHGTQARLRVGLAITFVLGAVFLVMQAVEWSHKMLTPQMSAYGSLYFTVTGFHGAHVAAGLLMILVVQVWAWQGAFSAERHGFVSNAALYWHFVDGVWIVVFVSLYLLPRMA
jgi:heme/copper-type cytochrome/quinol oxidase subunit 3